MANILQLRKGNSAQNRGFLGSVGELTYDTELDRLRVHNGTTVGGKVIVGTRIVTTPIDVNLETTTGVRIINGLGNTNLPLDVYGALNVYSNENFAIGALRVYQTFQPDIFNDLFFRKWDGAVWSAWERAVKFSEKNTEAFGVGQTWVDMSSSRTRDTVYTNNTGKPIVVTIAIPTNSGYTANLYCNSQIVAEWMQQSNGNFSLSNIIPNGSNYKLTTSYVGTAFRWWRELR